MIGVMLIAMLVRPRGADHAQPRHFGDRHHRGVAARGGRAELPDVVRRDRRADRRLCRVVRTPAPQARARAMPTRPRCAGLARQVGVYAIGLAATSLIAGTATAVFGAYHFQRVSPLSLGANLAAMPFVSVIVMPFAMIGDGPDAVRPRRLGLRGDGQGAVGDDRRRRLVLRAVADRFRRTDSGRRRRRADHRPGAGDACRPPGCGSPRCRWRWPGWR